MKSASPTDRPLTRANHRAAIRAHRRRAAITAAASVVVYGQQRSNCTLTTPTCRPKTSSRFQHRNQQYFVIALTDGAGGIEERYAYSAYGEPVFVSATGTVLTDSAKDNRYSYTGREWDEELNLYHFRARIYDAESGRFYGRDPIGFRGSRWQLYKFLGCKPLRYVAPIGHQEIDLPPIVVLPPEPPLPPYVLPQLPPLGPIVSDCQSAVSSLRPSISPIIAKLLECNVNIYCGNCSGFDGVALPSGPRGHSHICLDRENLDGQELRRIIALIIHEGTHIAQFLDANACACKGTPYRGPIPTIGGGVGGTNCEDCESAEEPAYRNQAEYLYPPHLPDAEAFYDAWVEAGTCRSCASPCNYVLQECPPFPEIPFPL